MKLQDILHRFWFHPHSHTTDPENRSDRHVTIPVQNRHNLEPHQRHGHLTVPDWPDHTGALPLTVNDRLVDPWFLGMNAMPYWNLDMPLGALTMPYIRTDEFTPQIDVHETCHEIILRAELPGVEEKSLNLTFDHDQLVLRGEKVDDTIPITEEDKKGFFSRYSECQNGRFERTLDFGPELIDPDQIQAVLNHGILTVRMGKRPSATARRITVQAA